MNATTGHRSSRDDAAVREGFVLPLIFLTVAIIGGLRVDPNDAGFRLLQPPLISLVLAMLLVSVLVRGRRLVPQRLMGGDRSPVQNLSGEVVLATLFAASAQVFNSITPETGLLHLVFNTFFVLLLWNTLAAGPEAGRLLHSLLVLLGSAFVLKHIVLASLYAPGGGITKRIVTTLLEGFTLGTLEYEPQAPSAGYIAFGGLVLFLIGLVLLPGAPPSTSLARADPSLGTSDGPGDDLGIIDVDDGPLDTVRLAPAADDESTGERS